MRHFEIDLLTLTDEKIEALLEEARRAEVSLPIDIPATREGLASFRSKFRCTRCGKCCDGTIRGLCGQGRIVINPSDFDRLKGKMKAKKLRRLVSRIDNGYLCCIYHALFSFRNQSPCAEFMMHARRFAEITRCRIQLANRLY